MKKFIIEHLEPELWQWCLIEYENISRIIGKNNLWFTNIANEKERRKLEKFGKVFAQSVRNLNLTNSCILDPEARSTLSSKEAKKFDYFIFGGILGDYPPKKRTANELSCFVKNAMKRNIGKEQMSTDNAVYTVKKIIFGKRLKDLKFSDGLKIKVNQFESIELPYKYNIVNEKPLVSKKIISYLKSKRDF